jgi:hypothetical protein
MSRDDELMRQANRIAEFAERLFGRAAEMDDEELDALYADLFPGRDPKEMAYGFATEAAQKYRLRGEDVPPHVQAILDQCGPVKALDSSKPSQLRKIIVGLISPKVGPTAEVSYAFRGKKDLSDKDRELLEEISKEVEENWEKDKSE